MIIRTIVKMTSGVIMKAFDVKSCPDCLKVLGDKDSPYLRCDKHIRAILYNAKKEIPCVVCEKYPQTFGKLTCDDWHCREEYRKSVEENMDKKQNALDVQISGNHYKDMKIQPIEYIHGNKLGWCEGNVVKYISRWRHKNGLEDLKKVKHYVDLLIELEGLE